jgi:L-asparaginase
LHDVQETEHPVHAVRVIATGGTIASHFDGQEWTEVPGRALVAELGRLPVQVDVDDVASGPSSNLTVDDMVAIARRVADCIAAAEAAGGATGVVVSHGTDTIELTAFVTDLLLRRSATRPAVVFTGSMRVHSHPAPDGPGNLRDAIALASSGAAAGREVMVCLDGGVHAADRVTKCNARSVDAVTSAPLAALGTVRDGLVELVAARPAARSGAIAFEPSVGLLTAYPGIDPAELDRALDGRRGIVVEVFGDLNVPRQLWSGIHRAWNDGVLVVLASRPFTHTTSTPDLALLGAVGAGGLTAQKARLATMAALGSCIDRDAAATWLADRALAYDPAERSST